MTKLNLGKVGAAFIIGLLLGGGLISFWGLCR